MSNQNKHITIIHPYYRNSEMFKHQQEEWAKFPKEILAKTSFIVVDDCSPSEDSVITSYLGIEILDLSIYRLQKKIKWNWLCCRNLAAYQAQAGWLLLTDMDHRVPLDSLQKLHDREFDERCFYTPSRVDAPNLTPYKDHPNSYFMSKELYWKIGGYDESFSGNYGTDGMYRKRCLEVAKHVRLDDIPLVRYPREVIADASTTDFARKEGRDNDAKKRIINQKIESGDFSIKVIQTPWERLV